MLPHLDIMDIKINTAFKLQKIQNSNADKTRYTILPVYDGYCLLSVTFLKAMLVQHK